VNAAVVTVGDELLDGRLADTNTSMLGARLRQLGLTIAAAHTSGDPEADIVLALRRALEDAEVVVVTGGLGPTEDDRTRHAVASLMGAELAFDEQAWQAIRVFIEKRGFPVHEANKRQALVPAGAEVLPNRFGTAPGFVATLDRPGGGCGRVFVLPGVPYEARGMFDEEVAPRIGQAGEPLLQRTLCFTGVTESVLGAKLATFMREGQAVRVGINAAWGFLRVTAQCAEAAALDAAAAEIKRIGARFLIGEGYVEIEELLAARLLEKGITVALAESITAGLAAARLGRVPGISAVLLEAVVAYANEAKQRRLGVAAELLEREGAVSEACARAMVEGLARESGARLTGAVTGIAGPGGGSDAKPVGLVWFATCFDGQVRALERRYGDVGRETIRQRAAVELLLLMLRALPPS
jgi:nicotinamide-nucleotide amidase